MVNATYLFIYFYFIFILVMILYLFNEDCRQPMTTSGFFSRFILTLDLYRRHICTQVYKSDITSYIIMYRCRSLR